MHRLHFAFPAGIDVFVATMKKMQANAQSGAVISLLQM
jgi:hypothetical protein